MQHTLHPSMRPGAIIGYRKNGTPIRLQAGGAPEDEGGNGGNGQDGGTGADAGQNGQDGQNGDGGDAGQGTGGQGSDGDGAGQSGSSSGQPAGGTGEGNAMAAVRADFKAERARRQQLEKNLATIQQAMKDQQTATEHRNKDLAKALGPTTDEPPDPETRARPSSPRSTRIPPTRSPPVPLAARLARATPQAAAATAAEPGTATAEARPASVTEQARATASRARTTAPSARSGTGDGHNGAPGGGRQWTVEDIAKASPSEVKAAMEAGLLTGLNIQPTKSKRR